MAIELEQTRASLIVAGTEYPLSNGTVLFDTTDGPVLLFYIEDTGLGMAPIERYRERSPYQHGDTDRGFTLLPRLMQVIFKVVAPGSTSKHLDTARSVLHGMFRPSRQSVSWRYHLANGDIRQIDGNITVGPRFSGSERDPWNWSMNFAVEYHMGDPAWYDPTEIVVTRANDAWDGGLEIPLAVPVVVGNSEFAGVETIVYDGTWETYPAIRITGPIFRPIITHQELGLTLPFTANGGGDIGVGQYWDITLSAAVKGVVDSSGVSMMRYLDSPNNLDTFHIAAAPDVVIGTNTIEMTGTGSNGSTSFRLSYYTRYIGI